MNIFTLFFLQNLAKYPPNAPNCTIFENFLMGACPRTPPPENAWLRHALQAPFKYPHFSKNILNPPPPPPGMKS